MSVREPVATDAVDEPRAFETCSIRWDVDRETTRIALLRLYDRVAVLQHIRETVVSRGTAASTCEIDADARLVDLPRDVVGELRSEGYDIVGGLQ